MHFILTENPLTSHCTPGMNSLPSPSLLLSLPPMTCLLPQSLSFPPQYIPFSSPYSFPLPSPLSIPPSEQKTHWSLFHAFHAVQCSFKHNAMGYKGGEMEHQVCTPFTPLLLEGCFTKNHVTPREISEIQNYVDMQNTGPCFFITHAHFSIMSYDNITSSATIQSANDNTISS